MGKSKGIKEVLVSSEVVDETITFSFSQICKKYNVTEELLIEMMEHGLFQPKFSAHKEIHCDLQTMHRIAAALRLQHDLGINLAGVVLALELTDEIEKMRKELDLLHKYFGEI